MNLATYPTRVHFAILCEKRERGDDQANELATCTHFTTLAPSYNTILYSTSMMIYDQSLAFKSF